MKILLYTVILGIVLSPILIAKPLAQDAAPAPAILVNPPSSVPEPAGQVPDTIIKKISDLIHAGQYPEAQQMTTGLLAAYPADARLIKTKTMLDKLLSTGQPAAPSVSPPPMAAAAAGGNSVYYNPDNPPPVPVPAPVTPSLPVGPTDAEIQAKASALAAQTAAAAAEKKAALIKTIRPSTAGAGLYADLCAKCHGNRGRGDTKMGMKLGARNFTDATVQASFTDTQALDVIKNGMKRAGMTVMRPSTLSESDCESLVAYVRTF